MHTAQKKFIFSNFYFRRMNNTGRDYHEFIHWVIGKKGNNVKLDTCNEFKSLVKEKKMKISKISKYKNILTKRLTDWSDERKFLIKEVKMRCFMNIVIG